MTMDENTDPKARSNFKSIPAEQMPREKVLKGGLKSLTDAELMALLIGTGIHGKSVLELCSEILADHHNHISEVTKLSVKELCHRYKGIGTAKAVTLLAALELGARSAADAAIVTRTPILTPKLASEIMRPHFCHLPHEEFWVMYLNHGAHLIREIRIGQGGVAATLVDVKIIIRHALDLSASYMILFHNHPSGTLKPSRNDDDLTEKIKKAADLFGIKVNDHIIITDGGYYSYSDQGRI